MNFVKIDALKGIICLRAKRNSYYYFPHLTSHLGEIPYIESEYSTVDNCEIRENWHRVDCTFLNSVNEINLRVSCIIYVIFIMHTLC